MSAQTPQRYDCAGPKHPWQHCDGCYHMEPHPRGDYVHWDDYESLRALNAELVAAVQRVTSYCDFCGGTGKIFHTLDPNGPFQRCPHCGDLNDLRALIARAKGEP